jgi:hypothetical protein
MEYAEPRPFNLAKVPALFRIVEKKWRKLAVFRGAKAPFFRVLEPGPLNTSH